jgi:hypothetical protein
MNGTVGTLGTLGTLGTSGTSGTFVTLISRESFASALIYAPARSRRSRRARRRSSNPSEEQDQLSARALADLDLGLFHFSGAPDVRSLRPRGRRPRVDLAGRRDRRHGSGCVVRQIARRRARSLHCPVQRGPSQSAVSAHLLHVRVERYGDLRGAEPDGAHRRDRARCVANATDLRRDIPAHGRCDARAGCAWLVAACPCVDAG